MGCRGNVWNTGCVELTYQTEVVVEAVVVMVVTAVTEVTTDPLSLKTPTHGCARWWSNSPMKM
jgi:hypothetical protein